jgi:4-amino-4-deoxy-L-arabinose transferase-like glycosyltransferase
VAVSRTRLSVRLFILALILGLTLPRMWQPGMFGDGLLYATIARNLSLGVGSFWTPSFTQTRWSQFFEQPPLGLALQAGAFWIFGDSLIIERAYSLALFGLHALVILTLWRRIAPASDDWLPLLFWILPSSVVWAVINNMLENTQALFTTAAVLVVYLASRAASAGRALLWTTMAVVAIAAAVLIKGPVGFFPIVAPAAFLLMPHAERPTLSRVALLTLTLIAGVAIIAAILAAYDPSRHALAEYARTHLIPALRGQRERVDDAWPTLRFLGLGILLRMSILAAVLWVIGRRLSTAITGPAGATWSFLALGLCASVPLAISPKLSGHYFLPSVPMFALGFASLVHESVRESMAWLAERTTDRMRRAVGVFAIVLVLAVTIGPLTQPRLRRRDGPLLGEIAAISSALPYGQTIGVCTDAEPTDWQLEAYMNRFHHVTLDRHAGPANGWWLRAARACVVPPSCSVAAHGDALALYRCQ